MTTEEEAQALVNKVRDERGRDRISAAFLKRKEYSIAEALCRTIDQRDAIQQEFDDFKLKVSDAITSAVADLNTKPPVVVQRSLSQFIIHEPKPDPLVDAAKMMGYFNTAANAWAEDVRTALDALGLEIREKNDD